MIGTNLDKVWACKLVHISLRLNPTTGFNPIVGFTSNYWMQKHPLVGCSNLCKAIADSRSHWEVAPYAQPAVQAINKYFNQTSNFYIIFPKITNWIHKSFCIMEKHPIVGCFELCILFYKLKYIFWEDISLWSFWISTHGAIIKQFWQ